MPNRIELSRLHELFGALVSLPPLHDALLDQPAQSLTSPGTAGVTVALLVVPLPPRPSSSGSDPGFRLSSRDF